MTPQDLLLEVFCPVDDELQALGLGRLRQRGPQPKLADSEAITMELVGEFRKLGTDRDLFRHFRRYHAAEFPTPAHLDRTTSTRQAANLWRLKQLLHERPARRLAGTTRCGWSTAWPVDACQSARATFCQRCRGQADYGYCHLRKRTLYGFRLHLRVSRGGIILAYQPAPARAGEKAVLPESGLPAGSVGIGGRNYWSAALRDRLAAGGVVLLAPYYQKRRAPDPRRSAPLSAVRYRIETSNGQLAERYGVQRTWAKDWWHLCHRIIRKVLSHTTRALVNFRAGLQPLQLDALAA